MISLMASLTSVIVDYAVKSNLIRIRKTKLHI